MSKVKEVTIVTKSTRMTTDFSPEAYRVLSNVASRLDTTKAEALRIALGLVDLVQRRQSEGWKFLMEHEKTKEREIIPPDWLNRGQIQS